MATQDEINGLRRLMESVNRMSASTAATQGKIVAEQMALRQEVRELRQMTERALQMCNSLTARMVALEAGRAAH